MTSSATMQTEPDRLRQRFIDNDAPVVFSRKVHSPVGWPDDEIGYNVDTPDPASVVRTVKLLRALLQTSTPSTWEEPHVSAGQDGEIILEWWGNHKKVTVYVSATSIDCIRVWGPNVDTEMNERPLQNDDDIREFWNWLKSS